MNARRLASIFCCLVATVSGAAYGQSERPNILLILVDDLGWTDLGCYGHPWHETPQIDRLAEQGMRFTNAYAPAPICSASRASILTGKTPARLNFEFVTKRLPGTQQLDLATPLAAPPYTLNLALAESTIAECLQATGYDTAFFGKWHLNAHHKRYLGWSPTHGPKQQGFLTAIEDFGGHPYAWQRHKPARLDEPGKFPPDSMVTRACEYLRRPNQEPFFLMVSHFYVHTPVKTPCRWLMRKYDDMIPADSPARRRRIRYAAFVETLDHYVGQLLTAVNETSHRDHTLVVFLSDNGGHPEYTANAPLRGSKWNLYEGGIRVPMIARWPERIAKSSRCDTPIIGYDLLPTLAEIANATHSSVDGISQGVLFDNQQSQQERDLIWHFPYYHPESGYSSALKKIGINDFRISRTGPQSAIRRGRFKLLKFYEENHTELYDLENDLGEQHNLSDRHRDLASELAESLDRSLRNMNARFAMPLAK